MLSTEIIEQALIKKQELLDQAIHNASTGIGTDSGQIAFLFQDITTLKIILLDAYRESKDVKIRPKAVKL